MNLRKMQKGSKFGDKKMLVFEREREREMALGLKPFFLVFETQNGADFEDAHPLQEMIPK